MGAFPVVEKSWNFVILYNVEKWEETWKIEIFSGNTHFLGVDSYVC